MTPRHWVLATGAGAVITGWLLRGTAAGGASWVLACAVAWHGYGAAVARLTRSPLTGAVGVVVGMATMLLGLSVLGHAGLASGPVMVGAVVLGTVLAGLPAAAFDTPARITGTGPTPWAAWGCAALVATVALALALIRQETPVVDGVNHVFAIAKLHQIGALVSDPGGFGAALVGEATACWAAPHLPMLFDALCLALVIAIVAPELVAEDAPTANLLLVALAAILVLEPMAAGQGCALALHVCAIVLIRRAASPWPAIVVALGLGLVRHELVFLAGPYAIGAIYVRRAQVTPRWLAAAGSLWLVIAFAATLALAVPPGLAALKTVLLVLVAPVAFMALRLLGSVGRTRDWHVVSFAACGYLAALATYAVPPWRHSGSATVVVWIGFAIAVITRAIDVRAGTLRVGAVSLVLAIVVYDSLIAVSYRREAQYLYDRFAMAVAAMRDRQSGTRERAEHALHAAQLHAPDGARLAFWGATAGSLDFRRNPIIDVTASPRGVWREPLRATRLEGIDYLLLEDIAAPRYEKREIVVLPAVSDDVREHLELVHRDRMVQLYRVR